MNSVIPTEAIKVDTSGPPLGSGAFGVVFKARYANELVVVKRLKLQALSKTAEEEFKKEAAILAGLNHPRIVRFLGISLENERCSIVLEYLPLGSLYAYYTANPTPPPLKTRLNLAMDVSTGMDFLHQRSPPLLHNDLKSPNILLYHDAAGELHAKITDFGVAKIKTATLTTTAAGIGGGGGGGGGVKGTLLWMAPELHNLRAKYRTSSDVYSFGVVLTELTSWVGPFGIPIPEIRYDAIHRLLTIEKRIPTIRHPIDVPENIQHLTHRCLDMVVGNRPAFADVSAMLEAICGDATGVGDGEGGGLGGEVGRGLVESVEFRVTETEVGEREMGGSESGGGGGGALGVF
ncbi:hypothetical protein HDU67_003852 [Dinochytrium kinnereticum]|nr:hypothetical protein HDU67_003852 [Dinochytrium kinnereticum]